jgi:hypothetical protein
LPLGKNIFSGNFRANIQGHKNNLQVHSVVVFLNQTPRSISIKNSAYLPRSGDFSKSFRKPSTENSYPMFMLFATFVFGENKFLFCWVGDKRMVCISKPVSGTALNVPKIYTVK